MVLGAALVGLWWLLGLLEGTGTAALVAISGLAVLAIAVPTVRPWLPERACQVSRVHMCRPPTRAALTWGLQLGMGVLTFVVTPALYALLIIAATQPQAIHGFALASLYGFSRGMVIAAVALAHGRALARGDGAMIGVGLERRLWPMLVLVVAVAAAFTAT